MDASRTVTLALDGSSLPGELTVPADAIGTVVFAHGSGSSRHSPRNQAVARSLWTAGLATLLFDLLTAEESHHRDNVFDIGLLAQRLVGAIDVLATGSLAEGAVRSPSPIGLFGASTGAAAALDAAAARPAAVAAVVSRGGRPDLATRRGEVRAPTLLIVGGGDEPVLSWNRAVAHELGAEVALVPDAGHLFEGPGELDRVAALAGGWFREHLGSAA